MISTYATTAVPFSIVHGRPEIDDLLDLTLMRSSTAPMQCVTSGSGHHLSFDLVPTTLPSRQLQRQLSTLHQELLAPSRTLKTCCWRTAEEIACPKCRT